MANDVFDEQFKNRLMAFQRDHGLTLDGSLGPESWTKLAEVAATTAPEKAGTSSPEGTEDRREVLPEAVETVPFTVTQEEYPTLFKLATLCVDEAGAKQFVLEELDVDLDEITAMIEEVLA